MREASSGPSSELAAQGPTAAAGASLKVTGMECGAQAPLVGEGWQESSLGGGGETF